MAPEGPPFYTAMKRGESGCEKVKGQYLVVSKDRDGGKSQGMDVWYAARCQII